jgi:para-nitrobenzyl esterase
MGEGCVQSSAFTGGAVWGNEDCLYVNVHVPSSISAASGHCGGLLPTMVYFHGGSFSGGSPDGYDGSSLAAFGRVVVVTVAFRLNVFGHLASDAVKVRSSDGSAGNFGIQDQRESLRWVRRNIASFCGDPSNVLIFGHSSGAASVANHLVSPPSWPLFHKALIQSGSFTKWGSHSMQLAEQNYRQVVSATGCTNASSTAALRLQCLVNSDAAIIARAGDVAVSCRDGCAWAPVVDNVELTAFPLELLEAGRFKRRVPLLLSSTSADGAGFLDEVPSGLTSATLTRDWIESYGDADAKALERLYPSVDGGAGYGTSDDWREYRRHTDASYLCTQKWAARYFSDEGSDVYQMVFDYDYDRTTGMERSHHPVTHGAEIPFVFMSRLGWVWSPPWWEQEEEAREMDAGPSQVAKIVAGYWAAFAHSGDPNSPAVEGGVQERPVWPCSHSHGGQPTSVESGNDNSTRSINSTNVDVSLWLSNAARGDVQITEVWGAQEAQCEFWGDRWDRYGSC